MLLHPSLGRGMPGLAMTAQVLAGLEAQAAVLDLTFVRAVVLFAVFAEGVSC